MPSGISLITHGIIEKPESRPTMPINVTILNPTKLEVSVVETNKLDVVVKD